MRVKKVCAMGALLVWVLGGSWLQAASQTRPPIEQTLVREGDLALALASALQLGESRDEDEAVGLLVSAGIAPANGWINDYPVTPDILGEIREGVLTASRTGKISLDLASAEHSWKQVISQLGLPEVAAESHPPAYPDAAARAFGDSSQVDEYYSSYGPPVVTYYPPPPDYVYLYSFVPYPFWCSGFWFDGFFVLHDFKKIVIVKKVKKVLTNKVLDRTERRFRRIDPIERKRAASRSDLASPAGQGNRVLSPGARKSAQSILGRSLHRSSGRGVGSGGSDSQAGVNSLRPAQAGGNPWDRNTGIGSAPSTPNRGSPGRSLERGSGAGAVLGGGSGSPGRTNSTRGNPLAQGGSRNPSNGFGSGPSAPDFGSSGQNQFLRGRDGGGGRQSRGWSGAGGKGAFAGGSHWGGGGRGGGGCKGRC